MPAVVASSSGRDLTRATSPDDAQLDEGYENIPVFNWTCFKFNWDSYREAKKLREQLDEKITKDPTIRDRGLHRLQEDLRSVWPSGELARLACFDELIEEEQVAIDVDRSLMNRMPSAFWEMRLAERQSQDSQSKYLRIFSSRYKPALDWLNQYRRDSGGIFDNAFDMLKEAEGDVEAVQCHKEAPEQMPFCSLVNEYEFRRVNEVLKHVAYSKLDPPTTLDKVKDYKGLIDTIMAVNLKVIKLLEACIRKDHENENIEQDRLGLRCSTVLEALAKHVARKLADRFTDMEKEAEILERELKKKEREKEREKKKAKKKSRNTVNDSGETSKR